MICLSVLADRVTLKTQIAYLRAILKQEVSWFDQRNVNELSSNLSKETGAIHRACGAKIGQIVFSVSMSISGFSFAFIKGWYLTLFLLCAFPFLVMIA